MGDYSHQQAMNKSRSPVILSAAKDLCTEQVERRDRSSFAALRMTSGGRLVMAGHYTSLY